MLRTAAVPEPVILSGFHRLPGPAGLQAGDNTLNILCSLRAARSIVSGRFADVSQPEVRAAVLSDYVRFLTTPGSHTDTYAESFHRSFFADWQDGRPTSPSEVNQEFLSSSNVHQTGSDSLVLFRF